MTAAERKSNSQQPPHTSPSQASYGVSIMTILEKIDHILTAPHCMKLFIQESLFENVS